MQLILNCPNTISSEKNYNRGGVVAEESTKDARTAQMTLCYNASHQSFIEIPVVK